MRTLSYALIAALSFLLTSCFDVLEEITLNKDGSGQYLVRMDMSEMLSNPFMASALEEEMKKQGDSTATENVDSTFRLTESRNLDNLELTAEEERLLDRVVMRMIMNKDDKQMVFTMQYPFDNFQQFNQINDLWSRLQAEQEAAKAMGDSTSSQNPLGMLGGLDGLANSRSTYFLRKKTLGREVMKGEKEEDEEMDAETMEMVKAFFEDVDFKTVYHLPGKVKKTTFKNAEVDGKTLTVTYSFVDLMEGKSDIGGTVTFK